MFLRVLVIALALAGCNAFDWDEPTALDEYVHRIDGAFAWKHIDTYRFAEDRVTMYIINMTSQYWMDESFSTQPVWWHFMGITVHDEPSDLSLSYLFVDGGNNDYGYGQPPPSDDELTNLLRIIVNRTQVTVAYIKQVPNAPIIFAEDPTQTGKGEDAMISWTWKDYTEKYPNQKPEVIARLPMTKAAKHGLDTINEFMKELIPGTDIQRFAVGGGSKRGWTAWSLACTDPRVVVVNPIVFSMLNMNTTLQTHYRNLGGGWSFTFSDYYNLNLTQHIHDQSMTDPVNGLWVYEDIFVYRERLDEVPKLVVGATGDEFFLLTDYYNWWDQMPGQKNLQMVPNAEHSLAPWYFKVGETVAAFLGRFLTGNAMPVLTWTRQYTGTGGELILHTNEEPAQIICWSAHTWRNETTKDFRLAVGYFPYVHPVLWEQVPFETLGAGNYKCSMENDPPGYVGFFFELRYDEPRDMRMFLTTEVHVIPDTYPVEPCYGEACYAYLT